MAQRQTLLSNLHVQYTAAFNTTVPNKCKNDVRWLRSKLLARENEKGEKLATKVADTIEKRMLEVTSPPTAKKQKLIPKTVNVLPDLLRKDATYEDWVKFNKLHLHATDEEKQLFVKKAKNENGGKESWYSVAKTKARLKDDEANVSEAEKQLKALFVSETLQNKISSLVLVLKQLYEKAPDNAVIPKELMPMVYEKLSSFLVAETKAMKSRVILEKIVPVVEAFDTADKETETSKLREVILSLKNDIEKCPDGERFQELKTAWKDELREKENELLKLQSGTNEVSGLDMMDGASQLM
jgi:hypothetical protein